MSKRLRLLPCLWCIALIAVGGWGWRSASAAADHVWWEGEQPSETNFPAPSEFAADNLEKRHLLSGDDWLSASGTREGPELFARYAVQIPADGKYRLWVRKFWHHGPFRWRIDQGEWQTFDRRIALADETMLAKNIVASWAHAGTATLAKGDHAFELRLLAEQGQDVVAAFDCFVLTAGPFAPNGRLRPGEKVGRSEVGYFPFEPELDAFEESPIDLRHLNERVAGERGFVRRDGAGFALGDGTPVRFWAANISAANVQQDHPSIDYMARKLAKLGVNMVRFHSPIFETPGDATKVNPRLLDGLFYTVAAMQREGIYTKLSFYFPVWMKASSAYGLEGFDDFKNKQPFALLYFDPRLQEMYRRWARELLTTTNPYTQLSLAQDPSVAIVEIANEDSLFFWTFSKQKIPPSQWAKVEAMFGAWAIAKHGSIERALDAWDDESLDGDAPRDARLGLYEAAHMTRKLLDKAGDGERARVADQVQFLAELQRGFYETMARHFKEDLKLGGLVSASNWVTADARLLGAIERWTYTVGDVIDRHGYFEPKHAGEAAEYSVRVGQTFTSRAGVQNPERLPLQFQQIEGFPQIISELGWPNPNRFRADATFLASAYGALQGIDGLFFFTLNSNHVRDTMMHKFAIGSPVISAGFPAAALQYRRADVTAAEPVVVQSLNLRDLFGLKGSAVAAADALDVFRRKDVPAGGVAEGPVSEFDPLTFYVGPFVTNFAGQPSRQRDITSLIDRERKTIRSLTGELTWDYGSGIARVNTPRSQGAAGFLGAAGRIDLADVTIECRNEYASVHVVSLDDLPLGESQRILIQAMTEEKPYGFKMGGDRITDIGEFPLGIREIDARISLKHSGRVTLQSLDLNGYVRSTIEAESGDIPLQPDSIYHVVIR